MIFSTAKNVHFRIWNPTESVPILNWFRFRIRFNCEEKLRVINLFRRCALTHMRVRPSICVCVIMRCLSEAAINLWEAMSVVCTACIYTGAAFFHEFLKFKEQ